MPPMEYLASTLPGLFIAACAAVLVVIIVIALMYTILCVGFLAAAIGWCVGGAVNWTFRLLARLVVAIAIAAIATTTVSHAMEPNDVCTAAPVRVRSWDVIAGINVRLNGTSIFVMNKHDVALVNVDVECIGDQPGIVISGSRSVSLINVNFKNCVRSVVLKRSWGVTVAGGVFEISRASKYAVFSGDTWSGEIRDCRFEFIGSQTKESTWWDRFTRMVMPSPTPTGSRKRAMISF